VLRNRRNFQEYRLLQKIAFLCLAGAVGTLARYAIGGLVQRSISSEFPIGTAAVNIIGCLLFGMAWSHSKMSK